MPLEGTNNWRDYVDIATHHGSPLLLFVQAFEKVACTSQIQEERQDTTQKDPTEDSMETFHGRNEDMNDERFEGFGDNPPREATREIDEGEVNPDIVEHFDMENEDHINAMDDDS
jgi:hypothetical protein